MTPPTPTREERLMARPRTMYMHTLDGKPASVQRGRKGGVWLALIGGRNKVQLRDSLEQIRADWVKCLDTVDRGEGHSAAYAAVSRYGYVLVSIPPRPVPIVPNDARRTT